MLRRLAEELIVLSRGALRSLQRREEGGSVELRHENRPWERREDQPCRSAWAW